MNRPCFFSPAVTCADRRVVLHDPVEVHHLTRVLRLHTGDDLAIVNGLGLVFKGTIVALDKSTVTIEGVAEEVPLPTGPRIILACALPKRTVFETILEKSVELGVDEIIPMVTARTEYHQGRDKTARFQQVMVSACKQSRRLWFPRVHPVMTFAAAVDLLAVPGQRLMLPWLEGERISLKAAINNFSSESQIPSAIVFFIGPEGDFTAPEAEILKAKGAIPVSLGDTVLRVETAALAVASYARLYLKP